MPTSPLGPLGVRRGLLPARCELVRLADGSTAVLKDFSAFEDPIRRALGRIAARREQRAYERLQDLKGVPRLLSAHDRPALLLEWIDARPLTERPPIVDPGVFVAALEDLLGQIHARGVSHGEVRLAHVLADSGGRPWLVDFATATVTDVRQPSTLYRLQRRLDRYGWLLIKQRLLPGALTTRELEEQRRDRALAFLFRHGTI